MYLKIIFARNDLKLLTAVSETCHGKSPTVVGEIDTQRYRWRVARKRVTAGR